MVFLDRIDERRRLTDFLNAKAGALACLYGRRRCGKSRLLRECVRGRAHCLYYTADRSELSAQLARWFDEAAALYPPMRAAAGRDWGAAFDLWLALAPPGAVLVLDEFPYLVERCAALPSILQRVVDRLPESGKKIVICGSSQRMMQGFVLKAGEPLYGRARELLPIRPLEFPWLARAFPKATPMECLRRWAVWGGVPRYWELQAGFRDLPSALQHHLSALGLLRHEPEFLLLDDVGDFAQTSTVLAFIGRGAHRLSEIAGRMGRPATDLSRPLQRLTDLGLIAKELPFGCDANSKKSVYRIADPFLDFWYGFVRQRWSREDFIGNAEELAEFESAFAVYLGGVWERLVRDTLMRCGLPGDRRQWLHAARWWGAASDRQPMEIDVLAESADHSTLLVGECKLALSARAAAEQLQRLREKVARLPLAAKYPKVEYHLFAAHSPSPSSLTLRWALQSQIANRKIEQSL